MNICFFCGSVGSKGGTERVSALIASNLSERKYNIHFLSLYEGMVPHFPVENKEVVYNEIFKNYSSFKLKYFKIVREVRKYVNDHNIDVIIDVDSILSLYTVPALFMNKVKHITWEHFNYYVTFGMKSRVIARWLSSRFSNTIVTLTKEDKNYWIEKLNPRSSVIQIYNPVIPRENSDTTIERKTVISVGRLTNQKGFDRLLVIWKDLICMHPDWQLIIVGEGEDKVTLEKQISANNLSDSVILVPFTSNISKYYTEASIYAMTSRFEGFPMVLLEASTFALPLIAFNCKTGPSELILDGSNGFLIQDNNYCEYTSKLSSLMADPELLNELSQNSLKLSERYLLPSIIKSWEETIDN